MRNLLFLLAIMIMVSCSKDNNNDGDYYTIEKATVKGVKVAFLSNGSRAGVMDQYGFKTMDENGNYKPIRFITSNQDTVDMDVNNIMDAGDKYIMLNGYFRISSPGGGITYENMIVNRETEATYLIPNIDGYERVTYHDKNDNIYMKGYGMVYKINTQNPNNMTLEQYLPTGQNPEYFTVNTDGVCHYSEGIHEQSKFKCPGGRIYDIKELVDPGKMDMMVIQGLNGKYHIVLSQWGSSENKIMIYRVDSKSDNELVATLMGEAKVDNWFSASYMYDFIPNKERGTLMYINKNTLVEYNENTGDITVSDIDHPNFLMDKENKQSHVTLLTTRLSKSCVYTLNDKILYKLDLKTLQVTKKDMIQEGYELSHDNLSSTTESDELTFAGLRYKDGMNVVGTIDNDFNIHVFENTLSSTPIMNLIRIN